MELEIVKFSQSLADQLFYASGELEEIASGFKFSEGPVWDPAAGCLFFTDFPQLMVYKWTEAAGCAAYRTDSGRAIGLAISAEGRLMAAESGSRAVTYLSDASSEVITGTYQGKRFNSPNDLTVAANGDVCFTDPYSAMMGKPKEIGLNGVYRVSPGGEARLLYGEMGRPNGLAFSPDGSLLYVNDTDTQEILAFDVRADGSVSKRGVFAQTDKSYGRGAPDGMKTDILGNVFVTGPGGIWVFAPDAEPAAIMRVPELVGNFCFGGESGDMVYITASTRVYRARVKIPGLTYGK